MVVYDTCVHDPCCVPRPARLDNQKRQRGLGAMAWPCYMRVCWKNCNTFNLIYFQLTSQQTQTTPMRQEESTASNAMLLTSNPTTEHCSLTCKLRRCHACKAGQENSKDSAGAVPAVRCLLHMTSTHTHTHTPEIPQLLPAAHISISEPILEASRTLAQDNGERGCETQMALRRL